MHACPPPFDHTWMTCLQIGHVFSFFSQWLMQSEWYIWWHGLSFFILSLFSKSLWQIEHIIVSFMLGLWYLISAIFLISSSFIPLLTNPIYSCMLRSSCEAKERTLKKCGICWDISFKKIIVFFYFISHIVNIWVIWIVS